MDNPDKTSLEGSEVALGQSRVWSRLDAIAPLEVWVLAILGVFFHFLAQYHFEDLWEPKLVYDHQLRFLIPAAFGIAILYAWTSRLGSLKIGKYSFSATVITEFGLGAAAVLYIYFFDPIIYVDDVGFILRYLDNFRDGCFYCYNVEDGPVFGISSFIYGLLAGIINLLHLLGPEQTLNYLTYVGVFTFMVLLFRIMRHHIPSPGLSGLLALAVITLDKSALSIFNSGMESPVHLSIVLAAMLFYLKKNHRMMWLFLALATISKLDVVPLVVVVGLFWTMENWKELLADISPKNKLWRALILYGGLPVVIWIVFAMLVFGSPLPQSAYAKVYFHNHSKGSWFPFLDRFVNSVYRAPLFWVMMSAFCMHIGAVVATRRKPTELVFGFSFVATMLLYYFYNPGERMQWYYTLPETLMMIQLAISVHWLFSRMKNASRTVAVGLVAGGAFMFLWSAEIVEVKGLRDYEYVVELERKRLGEYLGQSVPEGDTLLAGHGLIARHLNGYVIDQTGLNSRLTTDFQRKTDSLIHLLKPDYIVMHGYKWEVAKINKEPYVPDTAFYDITGFWYPTWRVFRKVESMSLSSGLYPIAQEHITGHEIHFIDEKHKFLHAKADDYKIVRPDINLREEYITLGIFRQEEDYTLRIRDILPGDSVVADYSIQIDKYTGRGSSITHSLTIPLALSGVLDSLPRGARTIEMTFSRNLHQVTVTDPMVSVARSDR